MKDHLGEYEPDYDSMIKDDRIPETEISDKVLRVLSKMQRNHHYDSSSSEDTMNDYIRDILDESYNVKDQTRQGDSTKGDEAGEIDTQQWFVLAGNFEKGKCKICVWCVCDSDEK